MDAGVVVGGVVFAVFVGWVVYWSRKDRKSGNGSGGSRHDEPRKDHVDPK